MFQGITIFQVGRRCKGRCLVIFWESYQEPMWEVTKRSRHIWNSFQGDGAKIKDTPLINILDGGVYLPISVQKIVYCTGHIIGGHKKDAKFVVESFFDPNNYLGPEKKLVDLHMFDGSSVCRKAQKYWRLSILCCHVMFEQSISTIMCLKDGNILRK